MTEQDVSQKSSKKPVTRRGILAHCEAEGLLSHEQAEQALELIRKKRPLLGEILVRRRVLTMKDVLAVLNEQAESPDCFGEIAIRLGLLDPPTLHAALKLQRELTPEPLSVLFENEVIDASTAVSAYGHYISALERELFSAGAAAQTVAAPLSRTGTK